MNVKEIQAALSAAKLDGWLFFDHHRRDPLAYRILNLPDDVSVTRRWYYLIPASGEPRKLVHKIETATLDSLPGTKLSYSNWTEQQTRLAELLAGQHKVAMQYSPKCAIPYVSMLDAGTFELVAASGVEIVSSANLVQQFDGLCTVRQFDMHVEAGRRVDLARRETFAFVFDCIKSGEPVNEFQAQQFMRRRFAALDLFTDHGPIVAVNANASDPHYEPSQDRCAEIKPDDLLLIDCWAKLNQPDAIFYDITWTGFCGHCVPDEINRVFEVVRDARQAASHLVAERVANRQPLQGFEVDDAARSHITRQGFGEFFIHRTGHSIGEEVHGTGANMDNLESHDERNIVAGSCFSIEPGIYLPGFGIRSEINMFVGPQQARVTGEEQLKLLSF